MNDHCGGFVGKKDKMWNNILSGSWNRSPGRTRSVMSLPNGNTFLVGVSLVLFMHCTKTVGKCSIKIDNDPLGQNHSLTTVIFRLKIVITRQVSSMMNSVSSLFRPTVKICLVLVDFEKWGRTDVRTTYVDIVITAKQDCGRPSGSTNSVGLVDQRKTSIFMPECV